MEKKEEWEKYKNKVDTLNMVYKGYEDRIAALETELKKKDKVIEDIRERLEVLDKKMKEREENEFII